MHYRILQLVAFLCQQLGEDGEAGPSGVQGIAGPAGPPGPPSGGAVYVRWGRKTCPSESTLVYEGKSIFISQIYYNTKIGR